MRSILTGLLFTVTSAQAAWLHMCPSPADRPDFRSDTRPGTQVLLPNGQRQRIVVSAAAVIPGCRSIELPMPLDEIEEIKPIPSAIAQRIGESIVLQGSENAGRYVISEVGSGSEAPILSSLPMPLRDNLLSGMRLQTFGSEERAQARIAGGRLSLQCEVGSKPAGVILRAPWSMSQANADLQLSASGDGRFELLTADTTSAERESASQLGYIDAASTRRTAAYALPHTAFDRGAWHSFSIACPNRKAELFLDDMRVVPRVQHPAARSAWIWNPNAWHAQPDAAFAHAKKHGIKVLFISVPLHEGRVRDPEALSSFVREAAEHGVEIWVVDGDPHMVIPGEHAATISRMRAYVAYNRSVDAAARLRGVQFDIEPYLLPGYELAQSAWDRRYLELMRGLHAAAEGLPLELVVPFWWAGKPGLLKEAAPFVNGLSVMDYRTDPKEIVRFAIPFLDWGHVYRKKVRIALEAGPVDAESQRRYMKSQSGELWLAKFWEMDFVMLLKEARSNPMGSAFRLTGTSAFDGSATSFHRDPARMLALLPVLEQDFSAWNSFAGIALHELK